MMCITTNTYSILINGEPKGLIWPLRGICQGDPISPYLFLICAEALLAMLKKEQIQGNIKGVVVCKQAPSISQFLFADESLVFCKATMNECNRVWEILQNYEIASGQQMNREKISLFFSKNTSPET